MSAIAFPLARLLLSALFIVSGTFKFMNVTGIANALMSKGFPQPTAFGYAVATIELVGGICLLIGFKARCAALALAAFTLVTIFVAHNFWDMEGAARAMNMTQALKNLAIVGGMLLIAAMGPGQWSLDSRTRV